MVGWPFSSSVETSASPVPSSMIAFSVSKAGLARKVVAAAFTAFCSSGVKARKRMLDAVAELARHRVGNVERVLRDEIDADALRPDQPHHLLDLLEQRLGRVLEQEMRLVEEEHELRLVGIADLGQLLEQLRHQEQQEGRVEPRRLHQLARPRAR